MTVEIYLADITLNPNGKPRRSVIIETDKEYSIAQPIDGEIYYISILKSDIKHCKITNKKLLGNECI